MGFECKTQCGFGSSPLLVELPTPTPPACGPSMKLHFGESSSVGSLHTGPENGVFTVGTFNQFEWRKGVILLFCVTVCTTMSMEKEKERIV